jgi:16S rRNA (guanine966-N2)-methyltransferase
MRIIAGRLGGRQLVGVPKGIRPTTDRLRESLFSSLGGTLRDSSWLDLFAGTGAIGIEALSRGATKVIFNERDRTAARVVRRNLEKLEIDQGWELRELDAFVFLRKYPVTSPFDFIFLDPPYAYPNYSKLLSRLLDWPGIGPETVLILEVFKKRALDFIPDRLVVTQRISAGDSIHLMLRLVNGEKSGHPIPDETSP